VKVSLTWESTCNACTSFFIFDISYFYVFQRYFLLLKLGFHGGQFFMLIVIYVLAQN
jgi:hypothetical protein